MIGLDCLARLPDNPAAAEAAAAEAMRDLVDAHARFAVAVRRVHRVTSHGGQRAAERRLGLPRWKLGPWAASPPGVDAVRRALARQPVTIRGPAPGSIPENAP